jgi:agmatine deiminase
MSTPGVREEPTAGIHAGGVPAGAAYLMPAEWEPHAATWISWPHNLKDWPGKFAPIPWVYGEIARLLARLEKVRILVNSAAHEKKAREILTSAAAPMENIECYRIPTDRIWARDYGPVFVRGQGGGLAIAGFRFNAWAKYPNYARDSRVAEKISRAIGCPVRPTLAQGEKVVLEGGSIDVNGRGSLLTTEECLLDREVQPRNPRLSREEIEGALREALGARNVLWLSRGITGDDTHGHVDDLCRFVAPARMVLCREKDPQDVNYRALEEDRERVEGFRLEDGSRPEVVFLPMPGPVLFRGRRLPASYANFYIANGGVIVPTFNDPADRQALGILADLFPGRTVVGIHAVDLVLGRGTVHCLTQQEPHQ